MKMIRWKRSATCGSAAGVLRPNLLAVAICFTAMATCVLAQAPTSPATQVVTIKEMHFDPATLNVKPGDRVEWKNEDIFSHTVTADDGTFASPLIAPGTSWQTTITKAGTIAYHCRPHPNMTARLVVGQPAAGSGSEKVAAHEGQGTLRWSLPRKPEEIHPILVNFTAALLPLAFLSDLLGRLLRRQTLHTAGLWMMVYEAAISPLTVLAGWWWKSAQAGQLPAKLITVHQWLGTAAAVLFIALAIWRWSYNKRAVPPGWAYLVCTGVVLLALVFQGSLGGAMVFGQ